MKFTGRFYYEMIILPIFFKIQRFLSRLRKNKRDFLASFKMVLFSLALSFSIFAVNGTSAVLATTIWCNPANVGSADGNSKVSGYISLHKALSVMSPGDEVIIADGDWRQAPEMFIDNKHTPPDGTPEKFSIVKAESDWKVKLPYIHIQAKMEHPQGFLEFRGIVFDNKYIGLGKNHICYHMHHTKFIRCGFLAHGLKGNNHNCGFGSADSSRAINQFNLMEECIAWGSGRYVFYCKFGKYNIFRRCVARHDQSDPQNIYKSRAYAIFNFRAYACDDTIYQNCISIDSDRIQNYPKPLNPETGGFWAGDSYGATGHILDGCMSIRDMIIAFYICGNEKHPGSTNIRNCVALDMAYKRPNTTTLSAFVLAQNQNVDISNITGVGAKLEGYDGIYFKKKGEKHVENCVLADVNDESVGINPSSKSETVVIRNVVSYNVGSNKHTRNSESVNPYKNGLTYPIKIDPGSKLTTMGRNGTVCGATILKKIGVSETLYGEQGWNKVTHDNLWPFPNEKKIRELMRKTVDGVSGIYGFCGDGQSLTNYIWGYFGNTVPPFNVRAIPANGKITLKWDPPAEIAIDSITGFNVYKLVGQTKMLVGGTVAGNTNCSKTISGLQNGSAYEFAVTAIDKEKGESGLSYKVRATPGKPEKLSTGKESAVLPAQKERNVENPKTAEKQFTNQFGMEFVLINPGTFTTGILSGEQETTQHQVTLTKSFYIQKTEATQGHWKRIMDKNPSFFKKCGDDCPVEQVSWDDVQQFIKRLNQLEKTKKYRLPTEAEWEYACRAGTQTPFSFGDCLTSQEANYDSDRPYLQCEKGLYRKKPISAKAFPPNPWGLMGMHGNVWEWCQDLLGKYSDNSATDPTGPPSGEFRVIRGGGWNSYAKACRSGNRSGINPSEHYANLGFRLVRDI